MKLIIASVLFLLFTKSIYAEDLKQSFSAKGTTSVDVENNEGRVIIEGVTSDTIEVTITKHKFPDSCKVDIKQKKDELKVELKAPGLLKTTTCHADVTIRGPITLNFDVKTGSGDVNLSKISGKVDVKTGNGNIAVTGSPKDLETKTGNGNIDVKGLESEAEVISGNGNINIEYAKLPATGKLELKTGHGEIVLMIPKDGKIKTDFISGLGQLKNEAGDAADAKFNIVVRTGSGGLHIKRSL